MTSPAKFPLIFFIVIDNISSSILAIKEIKASLLTLFLMTKAVSPMTEIGLKPIPIKSNSLI